MLLERHAAVELRQHPDNNNVTGAPRSSRTSPAPRQQQCYWSATQQSNFASTQTTTMLLERHAAVELRQHPDNNNVTGAPRSSRTSPAPRQQQCYWSATQQSNFASTQTTTMLLERYVAVELRKHLDNNNAFSPFQSAYRQHHSTETALVRIQNDHIHSLDRRKGVLAVLFDMTVDHSMLISQLRSIGIQGTALKWLESYMSNRTQTVCIGGHNSQRTLIESSIPQGSVLGPILFSICPLPLGGGYLQEA